MVFAGRQNALSLASPLYLLTGSSCLEKAQGKIEVNNDLHDGIDSLQAKSKKI